MLTWLRIIGSCCCLVLCVFFAYFGVRSYSAIDQISINPVKQVSIYFLSGKGRAHFLWRDMTKVSSTAYRRRVRLVPPALQWMDYGEEVWDTVWGKRRQLTGYFINERTIGVWAAHWLLVLIAGALTVLLKPAPRLRFSISGLLLVTTLIATTLGGIEFLKHAIGGFNVS